MSAISSPVSLPPIDRAELLLDAFPQRPIRLLHTGHHKYAILGALVMFLGALAILIGSLREVLPGIVTDARLKWNGDYVVDQLATVKGGCRQSKFIFISCDGEIVHNTVPGGPVMKTQLSFGYFGTELHKQIQVVRGSSDPSLVSTTGSLDHVAGIVIHFLLIHGLLAILAITTFRFGVQAVRAHRMVGKEVQLQAILVGVGRNTSNGPLQYSVHIDGKLSKGAANVKDGAAPFYLQWSGDVALAVLVAQTRQVIVLDEHLASLDLSKSEKERLIACAA